LIFTCTLCSNQSGPITFVRFLVAFLRSDFSFRISFLNGYLIVSDWQEIRKDFDAAESLFQRSLAAMPGDTLALCDYGSFLLNRRGKLDEAEIMLRKCLKVLFLVLISLFFVHKIILSPLID
jgi:hypothetical protein